MSQYISEKPSLTIISDTAMYSSDSIFVFEPVLREVDSFRYLFSNINWLGFRDQGPPPQNASKTLSNNLKLLQVKPCGGNTYFKKIIIIIFVPYYTYMILKLIKRSDIIHTRGPSIPALLTIISSFFYPSKKYWHKYGGDWQLGSKTISYKLQRWLLMKKVPGRVVVAARNEFDPPHILSWENPCLTEKEIHYNKQYGLNKKFNGKLIFCFVGRLEESKGFPLLLDAFSKLDDIDWISKMHCVGEGPKRGMFEKKTERNQTPIIFHGLLNRQALNQIYKESHIIILPSKSEGFPKVLAEASSFGCIPIISPIPCITNYINATKNNGIILNDLSLDEIIKTIMKLDKDRLHLNKISLNAINTSNLFTYERYNKNIKKTFINE